MSSSPVLIVPSQYIIDPAIDFLPPSGMPETSGKKKRKEVAVFVKVLLDYLNRSEPSLKGQVKQAVADCIERNRQGDPRYINLAISIKESAREIVGDWHWNRVKLIILYARQNSRQRSSDLSLRQFMSRSA